MTANRNELYSSLSVTRSTEMKSIPSLEEDKILLSFHKITSLPFQEIVNRCINQSHTNNDEQLWIRLSYPLKDEITAIKDIMYSFEEKKKQQKLSPRELFVLGNYYHASLQDYSSAISYFQQAELLGDVGALNNLGLIYLDGMGIKPNKNKAKEYFEFAIKKGNLLAKINLFYYYKDIEGMSKAEQYFQEIISTDNLCANSVHAAKLSAWILKDKNRKNNRSLAPSYVLEKLSKIKSYLETAAANGYVPALFNLAAMHNEYAHIHSGFSIFRSIQYFQFLIHYDCSSLGIPEYHLANIYYNGRLQCGLEPDFKLAAQYCEYSIIKGCSDVHKILADMYQLGGKGLTRDLNKAAKYYFLAWKEGPLEKVLLEYDIKKLLYTYKADDFLDIAFYVGLVLYPDRSMMNMGNRVRKEVHNDNEVESIKVNVFVKLDSLLRELAENKINDQDYYIDVLVEENLYDTERKMDVQNNLKHQEIVRRVTQKLIKRDELVQCCIATGPASIASSYLLGEEGNRSKYNYIQFFSDKNKIKNDPNNKKNNITAQPGCCIVS